MTRMVREAIEALQDLPQEQQEAVARAILDYVSHDEGVYHLTEVERAAVRAGLEEIKRGEIATEAEVQGVYKRIGV